MESTVISFENNENYNLLRRDRLGSCVTSIWDDDSFYEGDQTFPLPSFHYVTSQFSHFEKYIFPDSTKFSYHLSGYGTKFNEAFVSFLGESAERFSFVSQIPRLTHISIKASYNQMQSKFPGQVCPLELINSYFSKEKAKNYIFQDDVLLWVPMISLRKPSEKIYLPLQQVAPNLEADEKKFMPSAVSTGTANGESFCKALESACIEALQIDSFNLWWYAGFKGKKVGLNLEEFFKENIFRDTENFLENFDINFLDISFDKDIYVIVCEIFGKNPDLPKYTVGVQGAVSLENALYRSFMEAVTVLEFNMNISWIESEKYQNPIPDKINNLEDNVIKYARFGKGVKPEHRLQIEFESHDTDPLENVRRISKWGGCLEITGSEFEDLNLHTVRVCIPELLPLPIPSFVPKFHKRYQWAGGIINSLPHPLP